MTMERGISSATEPKHMRVGIDMSKADMMGLVALLIDKNVFTVDEYLEAIRRAANQELCMHEQDIKRKTGLNMTFFR